MSQQYRWHMIIEAEWEDLTRINPPCDIFNRFYHYFHLSFIETSSLCHEVEINVIWIKDKPHSNLFLVTQGCSSCEWSSDISGNIEKVSP